jgi:uncharacterized protein YceK
MRTEPNIEFGFVNKIPAQSVYGGVRQDGTIIAEAVGLLFVKHGDVDLPLLPALAVVDLPLSAVADTLTLPITVYAACTRGQDEHKATVGQPPISQVAVKPDPRPAADRPRD